MEEIRIWNRAAQREEIEKVYGDKWVRWMYQSGTGKALTDAVLTRSFISKAYGGIQSSALSRKKVKPFIRDFRIPMEEYEEKDFGSFNEFFIRKFRPGRRPFTQEAKLMPAFAEARYLAWESVKPEQHFPVKGAYLTPELLLADEKLAAEFTGGALMIARLCPVDYHRYHYPDDGTTARHFPVHGKYHSVNPVALRQRSEIFCTNERYVSILETKNFGKLAYIEVGAMMVGKIVQSHPPEQPFKRGDEKGYFLFGGSTVIVLGQPGRWKPDADLLENTARQREVLIQLGDRVASAGDSQMR